MYRLQLFKNPDDSEMGDDEFGGNVESIINAGDNILIIAKKRGNSDDAPKKKDLEDEEKSTIEVLVFDASGRRTDANLDSLRREVVGEEELSFLPLDDANEDEENLDGSRVKKMIYTGRYVVVLFYDGKMEIYRHDRVIRSSKSKQHKEGTSRRRKKKKKRKEEEIEILGEEEDDNSSQEDTFLKRLKKHKTIRYFSKKISEVHQICPQSGVCEPESCENVILILENHEMTIMNLETETNRLGDREEEFEGFVISSSAISTKSKGSSKSSFFLLECVPNMRRFESDRAKKIEEMKKERKAELSSRGLVSRFVHSQVLGETEEKGWEDLVFPDVVLYSYKLVRWMQRTPMEAMYSFLECGRYEKGLEVAKRYGLDTDEVYKRWWDDLGMVRGEAQGRTEKMIGQVLCKVGDESWVLDSVLRDPIGCGVKETRGIVRMGIEICGAVLLDEFVPEAERFVNEEDEIVRVLSGYYLQEREEEREGREMDILRKRKTLYSYLDKLETLSFLQLPVEEEEKEKEEEEEEEEQEEEEEVKRERRMCKLLLKFIKSGSVEFCKYLAQREFFKDIQVIFTFHDDLLLGEKLDILMNHIPSTVHPREFENLCPSLKYDEEDRKVIYWDTIPFRQMHRENADFVELLKVDVLSYDELGQKKKKKGKGGVKKKIEEIQIVDWYLDKARKIELETGLVSYSLYLVENIGMNKLNFVSSSEKTRLVRTEEQEKFLKFHQTLKSMDSLAYFEFDQELCDMTLDVFEKMDEFERFCLFMDKSKSKTTSRENKKREMFYDVFFSQLKDEGTEHSRKLNEEEKRRETRIVERYVMEKVTSLEDALDFFEFLFHRMEDRMQFVRISYLLLYDFDPHNKQEKEETKRKSKRKGQKDFIRCVQKIVNLMLMCKKKDRRENDEGGTGRDWKTLERALEDLEKHIKGLQILITRLPSYFDSLKSLRNSLVEGIKLKRKRENDPNDDNNHKIPVASEIVQQIMRRCSPKDNFEKIHKDLRLLHSNLFVISFSSFFSVLPTTTTTLPSTKEEEKKIELITMREIEKIYLKYCFLNDKFSVASQVIQTAVRSKIVSLAEIEKILFEVTQECVNSIYGPRDKDLELANRCVGFFHTSIVDELFPSASTSRRRGGARRRKASKESKEDLKKRKEKMITKWKIEENLIKAFTLSSRLFKCWKIPMQMRFDLSKKRVEKKKNSQQQHEEMEKMEMKHLLKEKDFKRKEILKYLIEENDNIGTHLEDLYQIYELISFPEFSTVVEIDDGKSKNFKRHSFEAILSKRKKRKMTKNQREVKKLAAFQFFKKKMYAKSLNLLQQLITGGYEEENNNEDLWQLCHDLLKKKREMDDRKKKEEGTNGIEISVLDQLIILQYGISTCSSMEKTREMMNMRKNISSQSGTVQ